jgi:hypothetical protein
MLIEVVVAVTINGRVLVLLYGFARHITTLIANKFSKSVSFI